MLEVINVKSGYGSLEILHGVSMRAEKGKITCIIGPNGSGKSTLLKTMVGILNPTEGKIVLEEEEITGLRPDIILSKGIAMIAQGRVIFPRMTVLENLKIGAYTIRRDKELVKKRLEYIYSIFPILEKRKNQLAYTLSGGEQMMLCIGRSLMINPKILMLDEPSLGLDPKRIDLTYRIIRDLNKMGVTLVIVEQNVRKALSVADYVYVLDLGTNRFEGKPGELLSDDRLVNLYLGSR